MGNNAVVRKSMQVIDHAAMLLLLQQGHSKPSMVAAPDVGWMASRTLLLVAGCLFCFVCIFLVSSCYPLSFHFFLLLLAFSCFVFLFFCLVSLVAFFFSFFACVIFFANVLIAVASAWPNHLAVYLCNAHVCLAVCGHRDRLCIDRRHRHGHRLCWMMLMVGANISLM